MIPNTTPAIARASSLGIDTLGDIELLSMLLPTSGEAIATTRAAALLERVGGLIGLARTGIGGFINDSHVGLKAGLRLAAAIELGRRIHGAMHAKNANPAMSDSDRVAAWAAGHLSSLDHEEVWLIVVDAHNTMRTARRIAIGGLHGVSVRVRDALRVALREGGSAMILVHNHPSGDPTPSNDDVAFTSILATAARVCGVPLLDHVIVSRDRHVSMVDTGQMGNIDDEANARSIRVPAGERSSKKRAHESPSRDTIRLRH